MHCFIWGCFLSKKIFAFYLFSYQCRNHDHMMSTDYDSYTDQFYLNYSLFQMSMTTSLCFVDIGTHIKFIVFYIIDSYSKNRNINDRHQKKKATACSKNSYIHAHIFMFRDWDLHVKIIFNENNNVWSFAIYVHCL